jgi:hypothetical protein
MRGCHFANFTSGTGGKKLNVQFNPRSRESLRRVGIVGGLRLGVRVGGMDIGG